MKSVKIGMACAGALFSLSLIAQTNNPFPQPIESSVGVIFVGVKDYAAIPDVAGEPARMMTMAHERGTGRQFISDMRGIIYLLSPAGSVSSYLNLTDWGVAVDSSWREAGMQSFAFHPQFAEEGSPGYGKFYTWVDSTDKNSAPDDMAVGGQATQHTLLLEWSAVDAKAGRYEGANPRELLRLEQPFRNHNGGEIAFNPLSTPDEADYGLLYVGVGDGGSGGDPLHLAQDRSKLFGKILRINPLGRNSPNGRYGIPANNPFVGAGEGVRGEIFAYGLRNPQHLAWDSQTGEMMVADIGQGSVEKVSLVTTGDNLGWSIWEGSFRFVNNAGVNLSGPRDEAGIRYPFVEYDHGDPLFGVTVAVSGLEIIRGAAVPQLQNRILFGELASGELFYVDANNRPMGGQSSVRRVLFNDGSGRAKTLLALIQEKNRAQGREPARRVDFRIFSAPDGTIYLMNKQDGVLRSLSPSA